MQNLDYYLTDFQDFNFSFNKKICNIKYNPQTFFKLWQEHK